ncbi:MAG: MerC domain-containing protein [Myxococcaceae bacterium]
MLGQVLSAVCAVHCVTTPLVLTLAPAGASVFGGAHPVLLVLVIGVALWAFIPGYRCHHSRRVLVLALTGVALLAIAAFLFHDSLPIETALSLMGASAMMGAHWLNRKLLREAHSHHDHSHSPAH